MKMLKSGMSLIIATIVFTALIGCGILAYNKLKGRTPAQSLSEIIQTSDYKKITPEEAKIIIDSTTPYILVDVRTESEYREGHIKGAALIPNTEIAKRAEKELPDKSALIIVYCRSGARSAAASNDLLDMGYTNVYDLGGIIDWPYETVTE